MEELGITIKFQGEAIGFDKSVAGMEKAINTLKKEVKALNKDLKVDPKNIITITDKMRNLYQQMILQKKVSQDWMNTIKKLSAEGKQFTTEWTEAQTKYFDSEEKLKKITDQFQKFSDQVYHSKKSLHEWAEEFEEIGDIAGKVANVFEPISSASQNFLSGAIDGAIEFESAFADVRKTVNGTDAELDAISAGLREMALTLPVSASELAKIAGLAGQMNVPTDQILDFTKAMVDFGNSTNITAEEAAQDIAQIYNVIGKGGDFSNLNNLLSAIVELGNNSATTEKAITTMFKNIASGASSVNMTEQQMVALSATLSSLGLDKGGASAISRILTEIDMAVTKGGEDLSAWASIVGSSGETFKQAWSQDSAQVLLDIVSAMSEMTDEGISMNEILSDLDIKELRQVDTMKRLVNAHDVYAQSLEMANSAYAEGTALQDEASKRYETMQSQIEILKNNFQEFAMTMGELLMPYVQQLVDGLMKLAKWLQTLSPQAQIMIGIMTAILAIIAPIFDWISKITYGISELMFVWEVFQPKLISVFNVVKNFLNGALTTIIGFAMAHPILTAIVALIAVGVVLYNNCVEFRNEVILLYRRMKELWKTFKETDWIQKLGDKFGWFGSILGWIIELISNIISLLGGAISKVGEFLGLASGLGGVGETMREIVGGGGWNVINSGGFGEMASGGFASGGITLNANFSVNSNNITRSDVKAWSEWLADDINEALGRRI